MPAGEYVMQDFEMNPMTFAGHKFDLRVWAVVLSLDPLRTPRCPRVGGDPRVRVSPSSLSHRSHHHGGRPLFEHSPRSPEAPRAQYAHFHVLVL